MERKEDDKREEGRKGVSKRTSKVEREGADCKEECKLGIRNLKLKGANKKYFTPPNHKIAA